MRMSEREKKRERGNSIFKLRLTILAVGWMTSICFRIVAPSLVISTLPLGVWIYFRRASKG